MIITRNPAAYAPSDGMTPCQFRADSWGRSTCATVGTPTVAVHVLVESLPVGRAGTHLCDFHSPYDVHTAPLPQGDAEWLATPCVLATGVSLAKATDAAMVYRPVREPLPYVVLTGADGSWITRESRAVVEGWRAQSIRVGAYEMAAAWGMVLRGEA